MIAGVTGSLLSHEVVAGAMLRHDEGVAEVSRKVRAWHARVWKEMGPAHGARSVFDRVAAPLLTALGFRVVSDTDRNDGCLHARLEADGRTVAVAVVTGWGRD